MLMARSIVQTPGLYYYLHGPWRQKPAKAPGSFTPFVQPTSPPPGSYDPALDAQGENADLGYLYSSEDYGTQKQRLTNDIALRQAQEQQAYGQRTADLGRNYQRLGTSQSERAAAMGVAEGGALTQALAKRTENQGHDQALIDTGHTQAQGALATQLLRGNADLDTNYGRAGQTHSLFGQQLNTEKVYQAGQAGLLPSAPANEFTRGKVTFRTEVHNGVVFHRHPDGNLVPIRKAKAR